MAKNILRKQFGNMYGKNKLYEIEEPSAKPASPSPALPQIESPTFTVSGIILFTLLVLLFLFLYLNREPILNFIKKIYTDFKPTDEVDKIEEKYNELTKNSKLLEDILNMEKKIMGRLDNTEKTNKDTLEAIERNKRELEEKIALSRFTSDYNMDSSFNKDVTEIKDKLYTLEEKENQKLINKQMDEKGAVNQIDERLSKYRKEQLVNYNGFCYIGYDRGKRECTNVYEGDVCISGQVFPTMEVCLNPNL